VRPYEVRRSGIQGRGVFATRRIRPGQRIIEYGGERISNAEADRRYDESRMKRHHTYLFTLTQRTVVDGNRAGNDARYINHSCDPNCEAVIENGRIFIYALKNIQRGTELAYDYKFEPDGESAEELKRTYPCRCGARNCRGTIMLLKAHRKKKRAAPR
jgi:SET domain-containing protein